MIEPTWREEPPDGVGYKAPDQQSMCYA